MIETRALSCVPTFRSSLPANSFYVEASGFTQLNECAHNEDAHFDGLFAVEHIRRHDRAVLGEGVRQVLNVLTPFPTN